MHQKEGRSVIRFLSSEGVKPIEIHRQMKVQYGDACLSLQQVYETTRKFMDGIRFDEKCSRRYTIGCALNQKNFFSRGIHALPKCWDTCMEHNGDYTEK
jgi:predicted nuclease with RNAse H fold